MRILLGTNVLVSVLIARGKPRKLWRRLVSQGVEIVASRAMLNELEEVLSRDTKSALATLVSENR